jgi:hypothetical protein
MKQGSFVGIACQGKDAKDIVMFRFIIELTALRLCVCLSLLV